MDKPNPELGRYNVSKKEEDTGAFKTPTLREIEHGAPYMHDGSLKTLEEVVSITTRGASRISGCPADEAAQPDKQDKSDLVAFMKALSGEGWRHIKAPTEKELPR